MDTKDKSFSLFIETALPKHIVENFPGFVGFLKSYYDWTEEHGNVGNVSHIMGDISSEDFIESNYLLLKDEYLKLYPDETFIRKDLFIKSIRELYSSKGTLSAVRSFFRIIFNEEIEVRLPVERALLPFNRELIKIYAVEPSASPSRILELKTLKDKWIKANNGAIAYVEDVTQYNIGTEEIFEFTLSNVDGPGFIRNDIVNVNFDFGFEGSNVSFTTTGVLGSSTVLSGGSGYNVGDILNVPASLTTAQARVSQVGINGEILSVVVINPGLRYTANQTVTSFSSSLGGASSGSGGSVRLNIAGEWDASQGIIKDATAGLYRYTIVSSIPSKLWRNLFVDTVHPAGVRFASELQSNTVVSEETGQLSLRMYSYSIPQRVNFNNPRYVSSREFFEPEIIIYKSDHLYDIFQRQNITFNDVFDPNKNLKIGDKPYQYGNGTYSEFPLDYFKVDTQVRSETQNAVRTQEVKDVFTNIGDTYNYTTGYLNDWYTYDINYAQNIYGDTNAGQLQFNIHYERSYIENIARSRFIFNDRNYLNDILVIPSDNNSQRERYYTLPEIGTINILDSELIGDHTEREIQNVWVDIKVENAEESVSFRDRGIFLKETNYAVFDDDLLIDDYSELSIEDFDSIYSSGVMRNKYYYRSTTNAVITQ